jgi:hypothetical protein
MLGSATLPKAPHLRPSAVPLRSLPRVQLTADAVQQLAACTQLDELDVEFNFTVR